ncbi:hypothetical protein ACFLSF_03720, partial [Candidatus Bipolaricaulota bacterium]
MTISRHRRAILCSLAVLLSLAGLSVAGQTQAPEDLVRVERTISTAHALPESVFRVTLRIEPLTD